MNVVVVESPSKARTINKYLGDTYTVLASYGHVRDLVEKDGAVKPDEGFAMDYEVSSEKRKVVNAIIKELNEGDSLYLATDPDREGEAIAWHILQTLKNSKSAPDIKVHRVAFHEVTREAILEAFEQPRDIDMGLVDAQQARRALDYLVGYTLSPVLWRKLPGAKSAGRVQSVALRLICEREDEIEAFDPREYWSVRADFGEQDEKFVARLHSLDEKKLEQFDLSDEKTASEAAHRVGEGKFSVVSVESKRVRRNPAPPFTTSTLQQEASRKLRMSAAQTMRAAQRLYEGIEIDGTTAGLITYMRTDAVNLSESAIAATRDAVERLHGETYLPGAPRRYKSRAKNAQEAHEAIRPTDPERTPEMLRGKLELDEAKLYGLIWQRTLASQMESAVFDQTSIRIEDESGAVGLRASGSVEMFDGFRKLYKESRDDEGPTKTDKENDGNASENGEQDSSSGLLPPLSKGQALGSVTPRAAQHFTEPPPRYTEASLVRRLEEIGVGRPSTYVSIISVLQNRNYVRLDRRRFVPENRGRLVTAFLRNFFNRYVGYDFTADLEERLDGVSRGEINWRDVLGDFWQTFKGNINEVSEIRLRDVLERLDSILGPQAFPKTEDGSDPRLCPKCKEGRLSLKISRYGAFFGCSRYPECKQVRPFGNGGTDEALRMEPVELGQHPDERVPVILKDGPYGPYIQLGSESAKEAKPKKRGKSATPKPKRVSLPPKMGPDDITLDIAVRLLALPREIGSHPETGKPVRAGIGRFGPYVQHERAYKSIPKDESVLEIGINRAIDLLSEARGGGAQGAKVIGQHPDDNKDITLRAGRFGPYVKHGSLNASLPKGMKESEVTPEVALRLLAERAKRKAAGKSKEKSRTPRKS